MEMAGDSRPDGIGDELAMDNYDGTVIRLYERLSQITQKTIPGLNKYATKPVSL